jgi:outer membrane lipoprotein SlyB
MREFASSSSRQINQSAVPAMRELDAAELDTVAGNGIIGAIVGGVVGGVSVYSACPPGGGRLRAGMAALGAIEGAIAGGLLCPL